jgi:hypothetical protein
MAPPLSTLPAALATALTPNDTTTFAPTRAIYVGTAGNLRVRFRDAAAVTDFSNVPAGVWPFSIVELHITGTTASGIVGLY